MAACQLKARLGFTPGHSCGEAAGQAGEAGPVAGIGAAGGRGAGTGGIVLRLLEHGGERRDRVLCHRRGDDFLAHADPLASSPRGVDTPLGRQAQVEQVSRPRFSRAGSTR
jgi:hypothetical protein